MNEHELNILVENELYKYILAISDDELEKVTLERIEEGMVWFFMIYGNKITKPQRNLVRQKVWRMFENKNKNLSQLSKEKYDLKINEVDDLEL